MDARRVLTWGLGSAAAVAGAVGAARLLPAEKKEPDHFVVETRAASITPHPSGAFDTVDAGATGELRGAWSNGALLIAVGTGGEIVRTDDPSHGFTREASGTERDLRAVAGPEGVAAGGASIVAVGDHGTVVARSAERAEWEGMGARFEEDLYGVDVARGVVVVGGHGRIAWARAKAEAGAEAEAEAEAHADAGAHAGAGAHADASRWVVVASGTSADLHAVTHDARGHLAVGAGGALVAQPDDSAPWAPVASGTRADLFAVAVLGEVAYAGGADGTIVRRGPRGSWTVMPTGVTTTIRAFARGLGTLFAVAEDGAVLRLAGDAWTREPPAPPDLRAIALRLDGLWGFGAGGLAVTRRLF